MRLPARVVVCECRAIGPRCIELAECVAKLRARAELARASGNSILVAFTPADIGVDLGALVAALDAHAATPVERDNVRRVIGE